MYNYLNLFDYIESRHEIQILSEHLYRYLLLGLCFINIDKYKLTIMEIFLVLLTYVDRSP